MVKLSPVIILSALALIAAPVDAQTPYWQCVPIARQVSGIQIYGDAWTWWGQARGRYATGNRPQVGAVLAFKPYGGMRLGHVAAVSGIVDARTILVTHSNWSLINGRRGQIERDVTVIDVSPGNDWSAVRVWFAPLQGLGGTAWPTHGFIYGNGGAPSRFAAPEVAPADEDVVEDGEWTSTGDLTGISFPAPEAAPPARDTRRLAALGRALHRLR